MKAFECQLCKVRPSTIKCPTGDWTVEACQRFRQLIINATDYYATVCHQSASFHMSYFFILPDIYIELVRTIATVRQYH